MEFMLIFCLFRGCEWSFAYYAACSEVSGGVVWGGEAVDGDSDRRGGMDEGDFSCRRVGVDGDCHVAYSAGFSGASFEEEEVAGLHFGAVDACALSVLLTRASREVYSELAEDVGCEARAVESFGAFASADVAYA